MNQKIEDLPTLKINTGDIEIEILDNYPKVIFSTQKYLPYLKVKVLKTGLEKKLYVSAMSLGSQLNKIYEDKGSLLNLKLNLKKENDTQFAKYIVEILNEK